MAGVCFADAAAAQAQDSHARMISALAEVARRSPLENPYIGASLLEDLRARFESLKDEDPLGTRIELLVAIGRLELQRGDEASAIRDLGRAQEILERVRQAGSIAGGAGGAGGAGASSASEEDLLIRVTYETAIAHLRLAETQNCVLHHAEGSCRFPITGSGVHVEQASARRAVALLGRVLEWAEPGSAAAICARWHLNLAHMALGEYPAGIAPELLIPESAYASGEAFPRFAEVARERGVAPFDLSGGAVVEDFDADGHLDLMTSTWNPEGPLHLFMGTAQGGFEERTQEAGLAGLTGGLNLVQGDYDGDGDMDVLVLRGAWLGVHGRHPNSLLRNEGGAFRDVTFAVGLGDVHYPTQTAAFADFDNDGDLDLYVGNEATPEDRYPCQLFRNEGDGTFRDVAGPLKVTNLRYTKGVTWGDYDGDGRIDLYVSNLGARNRLYRNTAEGFQDVAEELGVEKPLDSFPAWFWDYDNDGVLDLYVSCYDQGGRSGETEALRLSATVAGYMGEKQRAQRARLYRGNGAGGFEDVSKQTAMSRVTLTMGANFGDLDNDGFLDVYLGTGYPHNAGLVPNLMLRNDRGKRFVDVTTAGGFGHLQKGHAVVFADLDGDGDQDVYEQLGGAYPGDGYQNALFLNPGFENHWVRLKLQGVASNRHGLGARVRVVVLENGEERSVHRSLPASGSFGGNPWELHIGLGRAERIDRIEIRWPSSASLQVLREVPMERRLWIVEGAASVALEEARVGPSPSETGGHEE